MTLTEKQYEIAKPMFFNTPMVQAILDNKKSVTRRIIKPQPPILWDVLDPIITGKKDNGKDNIIAWRFQNSQNINLGGYVKWKYRIGDIVYVKETWTRVVPFGKDGTYDYYNEHIFYYANDEDREIVEKIDYCDDNGMSLNKPFPWNPSIHMPKKLARLFLRITDVRVERLQDITTEQAIKEGCGSPILEIKYILNEYKNYIAIENFKSIWGSTIKKKDIPYYNWDANPWVWVYEFERIK